MKSVAKKVWINFFSIGEDTNRGQTVRERHPERSEGTFTFILKMKQAVPILYDCKTFKDASFLSMTFPARIDFKTNLCFL
ncbi:MAG: hypothetical protein ACOYMA_21130 [Bacteroidia bacterium]